jgi:amino acid transporter
MTSNGLAKDAMAAGGQVVQSLAHIAPAVAVVFTASLIVSGASTAAPLAIVVSCLGVIPSVYLHSKIQARWTGSGGYCSVLPPAFNGTLGAAAGLLDFFYEPFVASIAIFGFIAFGLEPYVGRSLTLWEVMLLSQMLILGIFLLSRREVKVLSKLLFVFGLAEVLLFIGLAVSLIAQTPLTALSIAPIFSPQRFDLGGFGRAALFGTLMFVGFESGISFSAETKNSERSFRIGIWLSTAVSALVFIVSFSALVIALSSGGPLAHTTVEKLGSMPSPYLDAVVPAMMGRPVGQLVLLGVLFLSTVSCGMAAFGAGARNLFALGKTGVLPRSLTASSSAGVPIGGAKGCYLISVIVGILLTLVGAPAMAFEIGAAFYASMAIVFYCLVSLAGLFNCRSLGNAPAEGAFVAILSLIDLAIFLSLLVISIADYASKDGAIAIVPFLLVGVLLVTLFWAMRLSIGRPRVLARLQRSSYRRAASRI